MGGDGWKLPDKKSKSSAAKFIGAGTITGITVSEWKSKSELFIYFVTPPIILVNYPELFSVDGLENTLLNGSSNYGSTIISPFYCTNSSTN